MKKFILFNVIILILGVCLFFISGLLNPKQDYQEFLYKKFDYQENDREFTYLKNDISLEIDVSNNNVEIIRGGYLGNIKVEYSTSTINQFTSIELNSSENKLIVLQKSFKYDFIDEHDILMLNQFVRIILPLQLNLKNVELSTWGASSFETSFDGSLYNMFDFDLKVRTGIINVDSIYVNNFNLNAKNSIVRLKNVIANGKTNIISENSIVVCENFFYSPQSFIIITENSIVTISNLENIIPVKREYGILSEDSIIRYDGRTISGSEVVNLNAFSNPNLLYLVLIEAENSIVLI